MSLPRVATVLIAALVPFGVAAGCTTFGGNDPNPAGPDAVAEDAAVEAEPIDPGDDPDATVIVDASAIPDGGRIVFVTSTLHGGSFGGADPASGRCTVLAASVGLPGVYVAWIQDGDPRLRVGDGGGAYYLPDGTFVFPGPPALANEPAPAVAIDMNERGQRVDAGVRVWTGIGGANCLGWKQQTGQSALYGNPKTTTKWANAGTQGCGQMSRLYCLQK